MESEELSLDRAKARGRLTGELQEPRHGAEDMSPAEGATRAAGSPSGDLGRKNSQNVLKAEEAKEPAGGYQVGTREIY